ncbi:haloacid dehalogenase-like hydrolase domain-containing protein At2g33255 isoform X2 [Vitis vinifera]|uniref:haloacid dehalogenase-like hydrolase domain-containing protein At2g33255 isoform X2 n=1 Tax=Vitis vinifera TaxID=29760 RepID=UPI002882E568|nr:haloacid dehalogenase-like hydrolase domain-containing protein At2g33255 isoform X2 [Vitis vinifera]
MQFVLSRAICFVHPKSPFLLMATSTSVSSVSSIAIPRKARLRGVVFDMDGTLTVPVIDFPAMYRSVLGEDEYLSVKAKNPTGIDILHQIENWSPEKQRKAYETIADFERQGLDRLQIMPGAAELYNFLESKKMRRGLITRNVKAAVDLFHQRFGVGCGKQAGSFTCLLDETGKYSSDDMASAELKPNFKVSSLTQLQSLLEANFDLIP